MQNLNCDFCSTDKEMIEHGWDHGIVCESLIGKKAVKTTEEMAK